MLHKHTKFSTLPYEKRDDSGSGNDDDDNKPNSNNNRTRDSMGEGKDPDIWLIAVTLAPDIMTVL